MKECTVCNKILPLTEFHKRTYPSGNTGLQHKCRKCSTTVRKEYYKPHEKTRRKLGITEEQYEALMTTTHCQICQVPLTKKCIDHCHTTNKVRGVLCNNCNTALGLVGDNTETLTRMVDYLYNRGV